MSTAFTTPVIAHLQQQIAQTARRWGFSSKATQQVLSISENLTVQVAEDPAAAATTAQQPMALRLHRDGYHSEAEIRSELAWISALRRDGVVDTPAPRRAEDGDCLQRLTDPSCAPGHRIAVAFDWVPGENPDPAHHDLTPWFDHLGSLTARLHTHAQRWTAPPGFTRKAWTVDTTIGPQATWGPWQNAMGLTSRGAHTLAAASAQISQILTAYGQDEDRFGLIHGDLRLANLLVDGQTLRVIDFDDCGFSWFLFDFAAAISFHECDPAAPHWLAAWLSGYQKLRPLSDADLTVIPSLIMMRRIQLSAWLASHHEIPLARQLGSAFTDDTVAMAHDYLQGRLIGGDLVGNGRHATPFASGLLRTR